MWNNRQYPLFASFLANKKEAGQWSDVLGQRIQLKRCKPIMMMNGGRPVHEEQQLFELLTLESMQAGLSWAIIFE